MLQFYAEVFSNRKFLASIAIFAAALLVVSGFNIIGTLALTLIYFLLAFGVTSIWTAGKIEKIIEKRNAERYNLSVELTNEDIYKKLLTRLHFENLKKIECDKDGNVIVYTKHNYCKFLLENSQTLMIIANYVFFNLTLVTRNHQTSKIMLNIESKKIIPLILTAIMQNK